MFTLISQISNEKQEIEHLYKPFGEFIFDWLQAFTKIVKGGHKSQLKDSDLDLTKQVFKLLALFVEKGKDITFECIKLLPDFLAVNDEVELHV